MLAVAEETSGHVDWAARGIAVCYADSIDQSAIFWAAFSPGLRPESPALRGASPCPLLVPDYCCMRRLRGDFGSQLLPASLLCCLIFCFLWAYSYCRRSFDASITRFSIS